MFYCLNHYFNKFEKSGKQIILVFKSRSSGLWHNTMSQPRRQRLEVFTPLIMKAHAMCVTHNDGRQNKSWAGKTRCSSCIRSVGRLFNSSHPSFAVL